MFLPFLQGAQIAAHSSCQGNSASECPLECVCCLPCVCELPPGAKHTGAPLPLAPPHLFLIRVSSEIPSVAPSTRRTHVAQFAALVEAVSVVPSVCVSVCVCGECISGKMSSSTWILFLSCLSLLPLILTCMPTYIHSFHCLFSTTSSLSVSVHSYTHALLAQEDTPPPVAGRGPLHTPAPTPAHE